MKQIFTKAFFNLSAVDQVAVVDAALEELNQSWASKEDERRATRRRRWIERKAVEYGVWEDKDVEVIAANLQATRDSCLEGIDGSWEVNDEGFLAMAAAIEVVAKLLGIQLEDYKPTKENEEEDEEE